MAAAGLLLATHGRIQAQEPRGQVVGVVEDSLGRGILHAQIQIRESALVALSDSNGRFVIAKVPNGQHQLEVRALGNFDTTVAVVQGPRTATDTKIVLRAWPCAELECEGVQVAPAAPDTSAE